MVGLQLLCALVLASALATGCGDDGDSGGANQDETVSRSLAHEPPRLFAERLAKLLVTIRGKDDCGDIGVINGRSIARFPCPPARSLVESMKKFKVTASGEYGTGAVVEYRSGAAPDGSTLLLYVSPGRRWAISRMGVVTDPSVGTSDEDTRAGYEKAVEDYLTAVRERDCDAFLKVAYTGSATGQKACRTVFADTKKLAKNINASPSAEPQYQGGNSTYGFYALETAKPERTVTTISVIRAGSGTDETYLVLDAAAPPSYGFSQGLDTSG